MPSKATVPVTIRVPKEWIDALDLACKRRGITRSDYGKRALERALQGERDNPLPRAARVPSEASVHAARREVTTNFKGPAEPKKPFGTRGPAPRR